MKYVTHYTDVEKCQKMLAQAVMDSNDQWYQQCLKQLGYHAKTAKQFGFRYYDNPYNAVKHILIPTSEDDYIQLDYRLEDIADNKGYVIRTEPLIVCMALNTRHNRLLTCETISANTAVFLALR